MKKILILIGLIASFTSFGQSWDSYYGLLPQADISSRDSVQLLVIDAEKDSTYYILVSQLELIWSFDSTYLHYRVDSLSTVLVSPMVYPTAGIALSTGTAWGTSITNNSDSWNTAFGWGNHATAGYATQSALEDTASNIRTTISGLGGGHDAVTLAGTPDYITIDGQVITRNAINIATDVTGELDTANINMAQLDDKFIAKADSGKIVWDPDFITTTENTEGDSLWVDLNVQTTITDSDVHIPTSGAVVDYVAANGGGSATLDSTDLAFYSEIYPLFYFSTGNNNARDTAIFESGSILGAWFNRSGDTLVATSIVPSIRGDGGDTLQFQLAYNDTLANFSTEMVVMMEGSPMTLGTDAFGYSPLTEYTNIVHDTIPPDVWVWPHVASVQEGEKPRMFAMTVSGYRVKGTYDDSLWIVEEESGGSAPSVLDSNTEAWYIASADNIVITEADSVDAWNDVSGNNYNLTSPLTSRRPVFNGDSVYFDATDDYMAYDITDITYPYTAYFVINVHSWQNSVDIVNFGTSQLEHDNSEGAYVGDSIRIRAIPGFERFYVPDSEWCILSITWNDASGNIQVNDNANIDYIGSGINDAANMNLGNSLGSDVSFREIILRSIADSEADRTEIINYLNTKYTIF